MKSWLIHWKTTTNGLLAFFITTGLVVVGFTAAIPGAEAAKITSGITLFLALCRAWVGLIQKDAGTTLAKVPGIAQPQAVPAHSVPDDPRAKPVISTK